mgnify:CR=1 FL=1
MPRILTPADRDELVKLYLAGANEAQLARQLSVSKQQIKTELLRRGIRRNLVDQALFEWHQHTTLSYDDVVRFYLAGESENQVAKQCNSVRGVIRRILLLQGVTPRDQSESETLKWQNMPNETRQRQVTAAHAAMRGSTRSRDERITHALGVQRIGRLNGSERLMHGLLAERGVITVPQQAIGPYNSDLGATPVSVEILGGGWHYAPVRNANIVRKTRYALDAGWHVLMIEVTLRFPITPTQADYVVSYIEQARANPSAIREYRVIRGAGEFVTGGCANDDEITIENSFTARRNTTNGRYETIPR